MLRLTGRRRWRAGALPALLIAAAMPPASAQMVLSGDWRALMHEDLHERIPGPELGEFFGIPVNQDALWRAELWDASIQSLPEWQCRPHGADYITRGPSPPTIWKETDHASRQIVAFHAEWLRSVDRPIYMDGRPHPSPFAAHTWAGYSTANWVGDVLKVHTTHLKEDYVRRNGLPRSDKATMTEFLIRNREYLTWVTITHDPVYLAEPLIRTSDHSLQYQQQVPPYPCGVVTEVDRPPGFVPHYFPGENPYLGVAAETYDLPYETTMGGPVTMYPEYRERLAAGDVEVDLARAEPVPAAMPAGIELVHVNGPIYMLVGAGGNIAASVGLDGVLLVDSGSAEYSRSVLDTIGELQARLADRLDPPEPPWGAEGRSTILDNRNPPAPPKPVRYIINTSASADRTGGNQVIGAEHGVTYTGGNVAGTIGDAGEGAAVWAHEAALFRMIERGAPFDMLPTDTYYGAGAKLSHFFNGDGVRMLHMPGAQSDGATLVQFNRSDVIVTGDFFSQQSYPIIDVDSGGSIGGVIDALNFVLDLAIPEFRTEGGTMVIPAYGRLSDSADVGYYRDMVTIIRNNIAEMIERGMSLRQIQAARPTRAYDARFGNEGGDWTASMFVEAVYRSLTTGDRR